MELQNVKEYEYIRTETEFIRNCITSYMGFVIGGSGAAMFGLAALRVFGPENRIAMSYVSFAVSLLVALVLSILFYKFNSHNRYVGYSRVLADETYKQEFHEKYNHEAAHVAWELCMERLRMADGDSDEFRARAKELPLHGQLDKASKAAFDWMLDSFLGRPGEVPFVDRGKFVGGLRHLCLSLAGKRRTTSWAFPPTVVSVFFVLTVIYLLIGTYGTATYATDNLAGMLKDPWWHPAWFLVISGAIVIIIQLFIWHALCQKLFTLMEGSATVDGFCFRFVVTRAMFLDRLEVKPRYPSIEELLTVVKGQFPKKRSDGENEA